MADKYAGKIIAVGTDNLKYVISVYQDEVVERTVRGMVRHEGMRRFELQSGGTVKKLSESEYEVVATGMRITADEGQS